MARYGINPARGKVSSYRPAKINVVLLTCIPDLQGYFQHKLDILRISLHSLRQHTNLPYDLFVFDNGSCTEVIDYLSQQKEAGMIDYLFLSRRNIGKIGALKIVFNSLPGEIIAYADDDILYYPNWLEAQLDILEKFPRAGMVSGVPVRNASRHAMKSILKLVENEGAKVSISYERRIPDEWESDWALSTGRDVESHLQETQSHLDIVLKTNGLEAIGASNHFQFVCYKNVILQALPQDWSGKLMGHMLELDQAVDALGYLRLSTSKRYTRHLGNALSPRLMDELRSLGISIPEEAPSQHRHKKHWLLSLPGSGRLLKAVYNRLFYILHRIE